MSSDPENDNLLYHWRQVGDGPEITLSGADSARPNFTAPEVSADGASVTFELTVTDAGGLQDTDTCMVDNP